MTPQHFDALGQPIQVGDYVVLTRAGIKTSFSGIVTILTSKQITVERKMYTC